MGRISLSEGEITPQGYLMHFAAVSAFHSNYLSKWPLRPEEGRKVVIWCRSGKGSLLCDENGTLSNNKYHWSELLRTKGKRMTNRHAQLVIIRLSALQKVHWGEKEEIVDAASDFQSKALWEKGRVERVVERMWSFSRNWVVRMIQTRDMIFGPSWTPM